MLGFVTSPYLASDSRVLFSRGAVCLPSKLSPGSAAGGDGDAGGPRDTRSDTFNNLKQKYHESNMSYLYNHQVKSPYLAKTRT